MKVGDLVSMKSGVSSMGIAYKIEGLKVWVAWLNDLNVAYTFGHFADDLYILKRNLEVISESR